MAEMAWWTWRGEASEMELVPAAQLLARAELTRAAAEAFAERIEGGVVGRRWPRVVRRWEAKHRPRSVGNLGQVVAEALERGWRRSEARDPFRAAHLWDEIRRGRQ